MLALYIHWPFCLAKCPYCDFNSHVNARMDETRMVDALLAEMRNWHTRIAARPLTSIFFGGGTPSLLAPQNVARLLDTAEKLFGFAPLIEITLEANPTSCEAHKFRGFRDAGVNRLSLGVQALEDTALKALGREHTVAEAMGAIALAQDIFPRHSFDMIYARKNQTLQDWEKELRHALKLAASHLSLYQLTIEPGTVFAQKTALGQNFQAPDDVSDAMYNLTQTLLRDAGMPAYEVSNHARAGEESRHNLSYWHYDEYIGIGAGAHGRVRINGVLYATSNFKPPELWCKTVENSGAGTQDNTPLSLADEQTEHLMMNLRLYAGIDKTRWQQRYGSMLDSCILAGQKEMLLQHGFLAENATHLRATQNGMRLLNSVTEKLLR